MQKALIALTTTVALALAGALVAAPKTTSRTQNTFMTGSGIHAFGLTQRAQDLPEQS